MVLAAAWSGRRAVLPGRDTPWAGAVVLAVLVCGLGLRLCGWADAPVEAWASTNIVNLRDHPVSALLVSAVVTQDGSPLELALFAVSAALLERRVGTLRAATAALTGHVVASVVTEGIVRQNIWAGSTPRAEAWQLDVGISYLAFSAAAAALVCLQPWARAAGLGLLSAWTLVPLLQAPDMTAYGHALCLGVGIACWPWLQPPTGDAVHTVSFGNRLVSHLPRAIALAGLSTVAVVGVLTLGVGGPVLP